MKLKYPKWTVFLLICMSLTVYYFVHKAIEKHKGEEGYKKWLENAHRCGNPKDVDIAGNKDYYMDQQRIAKFLEVLNYVVPPPKPNKSGRMSYFVPSFRAMYLSPLSAKDYKEFITLIESMDIHKTLQENFKLEAGVINDGGKVRYFIANKDVTREEYIEFFKNNLRKFSILEDGRAISSLRFIPLQEGLITFEEKANVEADPFPPFRYLTHYFIFTFSRYCCDIKDTERMARYTKPEEMLYTLKDIPDLAAARKKNPNLIRETSDIELIGQLGRLETKNDVLALKSTPIPTAGEYGHYKSTAVNICRIEDLK